jgi:hypothetical protein
MPIRRLLIIVTLASSSSPAFAQEANKPSAFAITPHVGVTSESAFVDGPVVFSDGDVDFILVEPDTALLVGLELSYWFSPKLAGVLGLSYATADARYIENNDLRRDVGFDTLRIQPGVMATVVGGDKFALDVGGGLTLYRHSIDGLVWNDRRVDPSGFGLGLFGAAGIDVPLTSRLSFHSHLLLELSRAAYGGFEDDIAFADGEAGADVDHETRTGLVLAIGLGINL